VRGIDLLAVQVIRAVPIGPDRYADEGFHQNVEPPTECPHCGTHDTLSALGYYSRNVTSSERGVLRIRVRRFRCDVCRKTVSILPSFAQPYRLVLNATISEFFGGTINSNALSWLPLLKQYWNRFSNWLPKIQSILNSVVERSPPQRDPAGWWDAIAETFEGLERITTTLVSQFAVTLFGRYRCHSASTDGPIVR
jgi:hypothetical protein